MDKNPSTSKDSKGKAITLSLLYLAGFGWAVYSADKLWVKIFFGVMGFLLFIGVVDKIWGKSENDNDKEEPSEN